MAKVKVYNPEGVEFSKEPVDASECCITLGWSMEPDEKPATEKPKAQRKPKAAPALAQSDKE